MPAVFPAFAPAFSAPAFSSPFPSTFAPAGAPAVASQSNPANPANTDAAANAAAANLTNKSAANSLMGDTQDRFLTLLVTQLRNQDPLNPMDNAQVTSQIAQLSTVNGIEQLNKTLQAMSGQMDFSQAMQAAALIGKGVLVPGEKVRLGHEGEGENAVPVTTPFGFELYAQAANVQVDILDDAGQPVRTLELGKQDAGVHALQWDGLGEDGSPLPAGAYRVRVTALDANGKELAGEALTYGKVGSVAYAASGLQLDLGLAGSCSLYDIRQVM